MPLVNGKSLSSNPVCYTESDADTLREECGIFGVLSCNDAAALTALGLHSLQHRGQEAAGIVTFDGQQFFSERHLGLVGDHFSSAETIANLKGSNAIGHVRYSTAGGASTRNIQPLFAELDGGGIAICHNGHLTNGYSLREKLIKKGAIFQSTSDSEVIIQLTARSRKRKVIDRFIESITQIEGAFALVALTQNMLIGARDPFGIRPLVLGDLDGQPILASETCALDIVGAKFIREITNGEVVVCTRDKIDSFFPFEYTKPRPCIFEYIYFARPDSIIQNQSVYEVRKNFGIELAKECLIDADIVVPVPDSGVPATIGFSQESGLPFELGIIRNHYVGRTFIEPTQQIRALGVKLKHSANRQRVNGQRIILIDDSLVRGTTSLKIVQMMREAGAKEIHFRLASPPIQYPDHYGIDTPQKEHLLAATHSLEEMRKYINADTLEFLSIDGLYRALGHKSRNKKNPQFTDHCFTGEYPTNIVNVHGETLRFEDYPRLVEAS